MAPITWKNINAPDFKDSILALGSAGQSFDRASSGIDKLFTDYNQINNTNWDNQSAINTEDYLAKIKGITNLNDLNTQEANFDPTALRSTVGRQINAAALQEALLKRKGILQNEALTGATTEALNLASQTGSLPDAANMLRQKLIALGVKDEPTLANAMNDFMQKSGAPLQKSFDNAEKAATAQAMVQQLTGALPKSQSQQYVNSTHNNYGNRADGTKKGSGYYGELRMTDGSNSIATEISTGVNINGKEIEIPTLIPGLTLNEKSYLLQGGDPRNNDSIMAKAITHAKARINEGKSPFADTQAPYAPGSGVSYGQMMAESGGRDYDSNGNILTSPKGAMGRKQVLPSTALDPGLPGVRPMSREVWESGDKPKIVAELDRVGDEYMDALRKRYNGNEQLALAAYNAGFGAVDRAGGIPNIPETKNYVNRITDPANAKLIMDAAKGRSDLASANINQNAAQVNLDEAIKTKADKEYVAKTANDIVNHRSETGELNSVPPNINQNDPRYRIALAEANKFTSIEAVTSDPETQGYLANTSAEVQNNLERLQQELASKEAQLAKKVESQSYLMPSDDFMKSVKDKGIAEVFRNKTDQPGVVRDWFTPYDYADDVTEGITKIQNNLLKVYKDPEKVAQILAVSLKMAGAEGSGADGKRKNLDIDAIKEKLNDAKVFVESYVPLKNQYIGLQKNNQDIIRDAQLAAKMALNTDKTEAARKKISNKSYTQAAAINEFKTKMQEQLNRINGIQETPTYLSPETKVYIDNEIKPDKGLLNLLFGGN